MHTKFKVLQNKHMFKYSLKSILYQEKKNKDDSVFWLAKADLSIHLINSRILCPRPAPEVL